MINYIFIAIQMTKLLQAYRTSVFQFLPENVSRETARGITEACCLYSRKSSETVLHVVRNMATLPEPNTPAVCQRHTARQQKFLGKSFIWCVFLCTQISLRCFTTEFLYYTYLKELFYTLVLRFHHRMLQASQVSLRKPEYLGAFWCKQHTLQHNKLNFRVYMIACIWAAREEISWNLEAIWRVLIQLSLTVSIVLERSTVLA